MWKVWSLQAECEAADVSTEVLATTEALSALPEPSVAAALQTAAPLPGLLAAAAFVAALMY